MSAAKDTIALRNRLADRWRSKPYADHWIESMRTRQQLAVSIHLMPGVQADTLPDSPAYYVDGDALDVLATAAPTFQPEPLLATDLMTPAGFMLLDRSLYAYEYEGIDEHGQLLGESKAITIAPRNWRENPTRGPLVIAWWPITSGRPDAPDIHDRAFSLLPTAETHGTGVHIAAYLHTDSGDHILAQSMTIPFGEDFWLKKDDTNINAFMKPWQALLRLMQQDVLATTRETPGSKKSRRASKNEPVLVVRLPRRAPSRKSDAPGSVDWSHQWWVDPHWRKQWYPSIEAHRQKWINGYVKGPDDKPFIAREERAFTMTKREESA